jgi:hypothetical protein
MFNNQVIAGSSGQGGGFYDFPIEQSLRFEAGDSAYLSRNLVTDGNQKTFTISCWVKRSKLDSDIIMGRRIDGNNQWTLQFQSGGQLDFYNQIGGSISVRMITNAVFRDPSAWYHITCKVDVTTGTSANAIYVNGVEQSLSTDTSSNTNTFISSTGTHYIGQWEAGGSFDGYMADFNFIDGQALDATSFGELKSNIWIPKDTSGLTFGTMGFRLQFGDSAAIGDDTSGNTNDWTVNNLVASDVVLDSPTNNFPIILDDKGGTSQVYSEGNLHANISTNSYAAKSSMFVPMDSGKWYVEALSDATSGSGAGLGTYTPDSMNTLSSISYYFTGNIILATDMIHYYSSGQIYNAGSSVQSGLTTVGDKDIIGMLIDTDAKTVQFYVNGTASGTAETMANTTDPVAAQLHGHNSRPFMFNFGTDSSFANRKTSGSANATDANGIGDFYYTPPTGAKAICSENLPSGAINTLNDETPKDYFNTVLWTGDNTNNRQITGVGFQPSLVVAKSRPAISGFNWADAVRGGTKYLQSNTTNAEGTANIIMSFDSDGFSVGDGNGYDVNKSGEAVVGWSWKANGSGVSNTDGSIASTVSVGATSQQNWFSIVDFTGAGAAGTVGHGLGVVPSFIVYKRRSSGGDNWVVYHDGISSSENGGIYLNLTNVWNSDSSLWNNTAPTSSVFSVGTYGGASGENRIAYCFANAENLCRVGSYTGNGSTDGTFVFTGHKPSFLLIKETGNANSWELFDTARDPDNVASQRIFPNSSIAEATTNPSLDILSNGFKARAGNTGINRSGGSYIFLSISEQPFKFANAR